MSARKLDRRVADRYKIRPEDPHEGRFSSGFPVNQRQIVQIEVHDVSYSGIAFEAPAAQVPHVGSVIAVEFYLPEHPKMAWYARVVRLETISPQDPDSRVRVGAQFIDMPVLRRRELEKHIDYLIDQTKKDSANRIPILTSTLKVHRLYDSDLGRWIKSTILLAIALILAYYFIAYMYSIGSTDRIWKRPAIWPGYEEHKPEPLRPDIEKVLKN